MTRTFILAIALAGAAPTAVADVLARLRACRAETDAARRLACYDRLSGAQPVPAVPIAAATRPAPSAPAAETAAPAATPTAAPSQTQAEKFGARDLRERQEREAERNDPDRPEALTAKVSDLARQPNGAFVVTLDNGQVWRQTSVEDFFRLSVGDDIRIKPAAMGTFLLANKNGRSVRVRRVQ